MAETKYSDLDFAQIKDNLKNFLKSQSKFKDYDFDGSGMSVLLDLLAYNTAYNGFYLNMVANEMFLDSAALRESVVSRAKHLGYVPSSRRALSATVDIEFDFDPVRRPGVKTPEPTSGFLIKKSNALYTVVDTVRYIFTPKNEVYAQPIGNKKYLAKGVQIIEGKRLTYQWTYDSNLSKKQRFIIPNSNVDTSTLSVVVKQSATSSIKTPFTLFQDLNELTGTDAVYFLEESPGEKYEIIFGDGILGKKLEDGNVIQIEYVVPTNDVAVGSSAFYPIVGWDVDITSISSIKCTIPAKDYSEKESIDSIKFAAPKMYDAQNRAVTQSDYETLLKKDMSVIDPKIQYLRVWGGEENDPPEYGKVFCAIKPYYALALNPIEKQKIIENYIRPKNIISVQVEIVEPDYIGLMLYSTVTYFASRTTNTKDTIKNLVIGKIKEFKNKNIIGFDSDFRHSKFVSEIDSADPSIESNITTVKLKYQFSPPLSTPFSSDISLSNEIDKGDVKNGVSSITSSPFYYVNNLVVISDNGAGELGIYPATSAIKGASLKTVGSVDYVTGKISIQKLVVDLIPNNKNYIELYVKPRYNDVIAYKNQILLLEDHDINVTVVDINSIKTS